MLLALRVSPEAVLLLPMAFLSNGFDFSDSFVLDPRYLEGKYECDEGLMAPLPADLKSHG